MTREVVKLPLFSPFSDVRLINACTHVWTPRKALLFGYIRAEKQCSACNTWSSHG